MGKKVNQLVFKALHSGRVFAIWMRESVETKTVLHSWYGTSTLEESHRLPLFSYILIPLWKDLLRNPVLKQQGGVQNIPLVRIVFVRKFLIRRSDQQVLAKMSHILRCIQITLGRG